MSPLRAATTGQRRLRLLFPAQLELPTWQYASARRPILSTDATALVVRLGTPRVGRMVAQGQKRKSGPAILNSVLPSTADISTRGGHVRKEPQHGCIRGSNEGRNGIARLPPKRR